MRPLALALAAMLLTTAGAARAQQDFSGVEIKVTRVAGTVWMLEGAGIGPGEPRIVVNTHWHRDHVGGNADFGKASVIVAQDNVRTRMEAGVAGGDRPVAPAPHEALPVITLTDSATIHFNGEDIRIVHYPGGHTDGDCVFFFPKSNVLTTGDLFFSGRFPFVDLAGGGNVDRYTDNVQRLLDRVAPDAKIIPGHGPLSAVEDLRTFERMLRETSRIVRREMADGRSLDQVREAGLPDEWKGWSWDFVDTPRWVETIYRSAGTSKP
jgi:cyclase